MSRQIMPDEPFAAPGIYAVTEAPPVRAKLRP
jgi:hypothetical protein